MQDLEQQSGVVLTHSTSPLLSRSALCLCILCLVLSFLFLWPQSGLGPADGIRHDRRGRRHRQQCRGAGPGQGDRRRPAQGRRAGRGDSRDLGYPDGAVQGHHRQDPRPDHRLRPAVQGSFRKGRGGPLPGQDPGGGGPGQSHERPARPGVCFMRWPRSPRSW